MSTAEFWSADRITSDYGDPRPNGRIHRGTDWSHSTQSGTPIPSPVAGRVISKLSPASWHGFGYQVTIDTGSGTFSFAHLHKASPLRLKQRVKVGDILGHEGTTGSATGPCVHVEFYRAGFHDPAPQIAALMGALAALETKPIPTPAPPREDDDGMLKPKLIKRTTGNPEWSLCAPWLRGDDDKQKGYLVTTDPEKAKAWARLYDFGFGNETEGDRDEYVVMQAAARELWDQAQLAV